MTRTNRESTGHMKPEGISCLFAQAEERVRLFRADAPYRSLPFYKNYSKYVVRALSCVQLQGASYLYNNYQLAYASSS